MHRSNDFKDAYRITREHERIAMPRNYSRTMIRNDYSTIINETIVIGTTRTCDMKTTKNLLLTTAWKRIRDQFQSNAYQCNGCVCFVCDKKTNH
jgi:hypothetical protein